MSDAVLFTPLRVAGLQLRNRIVIAPMCQYSADEGRATDWHVIHFGHLALSGAALLTIETTAVTPEGRISHRDRCARLSAPRVPVAPFKPQNRRVRRHLENRMRFPLEVFDAARATFPSNLPVTMRVSGTDWARGGWDIEQTSRSRGRSRRAGAAPVHVSSGGLAPAQRIPVGPNYQVPLARAVKAATKMPVIAVGLITHFEQAEAILSTGDADMVALARAILYKRAGPGMRRRISGRA